MPLIRDTRRTCVCGTRGMRLTVRTWRHSKWLVSTFTFAMITSPNSPSLNLYFYNPWQATIRFMTTGERGDPIGAAPPRPRPPPVFPSRDQFALTYYASTPVSSLPNQWLPLYFASQVAYSCSNM